MYVGEQSRNKGGLGYEGKIDVLLHFDVDVVIINDGFFKYAFGIFGHCLVWNNDLFSFIGISGIEIDSFATCVCTVFCYAPTGVCKS